MPTTNITSKHKLTGNGFSSRATNKIQIGSASADQANGSSEDASICLHPVKKAKPRAMQAQLPTSIGESSTLFSELRTKESGRKLRIMSQGDSASGPWTDSVIDVGPDGLTLPEMMLPSDVLQAAANRGANVGETRLIIPEHVTTMEVKHGGDSVTTNSEVGLGVQVKLVQTKGVPHYWDIETTDLASLFNLVHEWTPDPTTLHYYIANNTSFPGNYSDPGYPTETGVYRYESIDQDFVVYAPKHEAFHKIPGSRFYLKLYNALVYLNSSLEGQQPHGFDPFDPELPQGKVRRRTSIDHDFHHADTGYTESQYNKGLLFGEKSVVEAALSRPLYIGTSNYFTPSWSSATTTSHTGTVSCSDFYTTEPTLVPSGSIKVFSPHTSNYGQPQVESFSYEYPADPTTSIDLHQQAEQQAIALAPAAAAEYEQDIASVTPVFVPGDISEQDVLDANITPSSSIEVKDLHVLSGGGTASVDADPVLSIPYDDIPEGGTWQDSPTRLSLVKSFPNTSNSYIDPTFEGTSIVAFANGGVSPYRILLSRTERHEVTFGKSLFGLSDILDDDRMYRDNKAYDLPVLLNSEGDPYFVSPTGATDPSVEISVNTSPREIVTPPTWRNPQSYFSDSVTIPDGGGYSFSGSSLLLLPSLDSSRYGLLFVGTSEVSVVESSHRSNVVVPETGTAQASLSSNGNYAFGRFHRFGFITSYNSDMSNSFESPGNPPFFQGDLAGHVYFDVTMDTTISGVPVHRVLPEEANAFDTKLFSYHDYGEIERIPGVITAQFWRDRAAFLSGFAPHDDPQDSLALSSSIGTGGVTVVVDGPDPLAGAKQLLHPMAVAGIDEDWFKTPTNPGQPVDVNNLWFDAHKMATDLLQPNQVVNMDARLDEEVFAGVLTYKYSPAAVYEAVIHAIALDVISEDNGWDVTTNTVKEATSADKFFSHEARLGAIKASALTDVSTDPATFDKTLFNTGNYTGDLFGIYSAQQAYHGSINVVPEFDLGGELYNLVLMTPTETSGSELNICSTDGERELGMMLKLLNTLCNSTQNAVSNATFVNLWWSKIQGYFGDGTMEHIDQCSVNKHNRSSGHLVPGLYRPNLSGFIRTDYCGRTYTHSFDLGNVSSDYGQIANILIDDVWMNPGPHMSGPIADICRGYRSTGPTTHIYDLVLPMSFTESLDLTGSYTKLDGTVGTAQDIVDGAADGFVVAEYSGSLTDTTSHHTQTLTALRDEWAVDPATWTNPGVIGTDTLMHRLPSTRSWYASFNGVHTDSYEYKFISVEPGGLSTLDGLILEQEQSMFGIPSTLTMVPANMKGLASGQVDLPAYYASSADQYWNSLLPLSSQLDTSSTLVNTRGDLTMSYRLEQFGTVIRPGVAYEAPNVTSSPAGSGYKWRAITWDVNTGTSQELTENREMTLADTSLTPFTMALVTDVAEGEIRKTWEDENNIVFDGVTGLFLYDTGEVTGVHSGEFEPQGGSATSPVDSALLGELRDRQSEFDTAMANTIDGRLFNFDEQLMLPNAGIHSGPITAHPSLADSSYSITLPDGDEHKSDFKVQPTGVATSTVYYQYTNVDGDTRYMYPVFSSPTAAGASDISFGGSGNSSAYIVTDSGAVPVLEADPSSATLAAGESLVYLPDTAASDIRDTLSREFIKYDLTIQDAIYQSRSFTESGDGELVTGSIVIKSGYYDTVDMFFAGADVALSGRHVYPIQKASYSNKHEDAILLDGTHTVSDLTGKGRITPGDGGSLEIVVSGGEVTAVRVTDPGSGFTLGSGIYIDQLADLGIASSNNRWIVLKVDSVDLDEGVPVDLLSPVNPDAETAETALLTWDTLATAATRPASGGLASDPDPGRAILYEMYNLGVDTDNDPGEPWLAPSPCVLSARQQEAVKAGLTLKGSRLASRFLPGTTGTEIQSTSTRRLYKTGQDRIAAGSPQHAMASPSDDPFTIDSLYLNDFLPMRYVTKAKRL